MVDLPQPGPLDAAALHLVEASHHLPPDELAPLVDAAVRAAGFAGAGMYLVDHELRDLVPFPVDDRRVLAVDGTVAGLAFRRERPQLGDADGGRRRLWLPLLDGVERLGVLHIDADSLDEGVFREGMRLASIVSELLISKAMYGDNLERARRLRPLTLAAELRWAMLPPLYFATPEVSIACALEPSYEIAGDAFDYALNGDRLHFAVFDAMGHGLEAARLANIAVASYRHNRRQGGALGDVYVAIGAALNSQFGYDRFVTGQLGTIDVRTGATTMLNAGHPPPMLLRGGSLVPVDLGRPSLPFGIGEEAAPSAQLALEPGDRLVLYTDGLVEARSATGERFGLDRLRDVITISFSEQYSAGEAVRRLMHAVLGHLGGVPEDDGTIVLVSWEGPAR